MIKSNSWTLNGYRVRRRGQSGLARIEPDQIYVLLQLKKCPKSWTNFSSLWRTSLMKQSLFYSLLKNLHISLRTNESSNAAVTSFKKVSEMKHNLATNN